MSIIELESLLYRKRNVVYAFVRHKLMLLCKQSVRKQMEIKNLQILHNDDVSFIIQSFSTHVSHSLFGNGQLQSR